MTKKEVDLQKLTPFVIMILEIELCFNMWWTDLPDDANVINWKLQRGSADASELEELEKDKKT